MQGHGCCYTTTIMVVVGAMALLPIYFGCFGHGAILSVDDLYDSSTFHLCNTLPTSPKAHETNRGHMTSLPQALILLLSVP